MKMRCGHNIILMAVCAWVCCATNLMGGWSGNTLGCNRENKWKRDGCLNVRFLESSSEEVHFDGAAVFELTQAVKCLLSEIPILVKCNIEALENELEQIVFASKNRTSDSLSQEIEALSKKLLSALRSEAGALEMYISSSVMHEIKDIVAQALPVLNAAGVGIDPIISALNALIPYTVTNTSYTDTTTTSTTTVTTYELKVTPPGPAPVQLSTLSDPESKESQKSKVSEGDEVVDPQIVIDLDHEITGDASETLGADENDNASEEKSKETESE